MNYSLYIHLPFCKKKCSYCDFFSIQIRSDLELEILLEAIAKEIELRLENAEIDHIDTIFIGGGTPSVIPVYLLSRFFNRVWKIIGKRISENAEITIEANIKSCSRDFLHICRDVGINRLSLGVQSFNKNTLRKIGRAVYPENIFGDTEKIVNSWSKDFSLDIISGIDEAYIEDIKKAILLKPNHISVYQLTVEEGTELNDKMVKGTFRRPSNALQKKAIFDIDEYLVRKGYSRYEVSNYAKKGKESKHNLKYWNMQSYIGVGPSAVSSIYYKDTNIRISNIASILEYVEGIKQGKPFSEIENLSRIDFLIEHYIMGCRLIEGINKEIFCKRFEKSPAQFIPVTIAKWMKSDCINKNGVGQASLNAKGLLFLDSFLKDVYDELT